LRRLGLQAKLTKTLMAHLEFTALSMLPLSFASFQSRLHKEHQKQVYKHKLATSHFRVLRTQSTLIDSNFVRTNQSEVQFAAILGKKITLKEVKNYIYRLGQLKQRAFRPSTRETLPSAFDFC
jgi:hypothetical protein